MTILSTLEQQIGFDAATAASVAFGYFCIFTIFTAAVFLQRRREAFEWTPGMMKSALVNWALMTSNRVLEPALAIVGAYAVILNINIGLPRLDPTFWDDKPVLLQAFVGLIAFDFVVYWAHRIRHTPLLWPMHAVHHSDRDMNFTTSVRSHFIESMFGRFFVIFFLYGLGADFHAVLAVALFAEFHDYYVHSKLNIDHGPLNLLIASPRIHQWHHADHPDAYDKNLALICPIWDRLFGTYYNPGYSPRDANVSLGFEGAPGQGYVELLIYPFKEWGRMISRRFTKIVPAE